jgi:hypothetical protein
LQLRQPAKQQYGREGYCGNEGANFLAWCQLSCNF